MTTLEADPMKMSEDERQCLSESRGGSANVISIFSYCARRYYAVGDKGSIDEYYGDFPMTQLKWMVHRLDSPLSHQILMNI